MQNEVKNHNNNNNNNENEMGIYIEKNILEIKQQKKIEEYTMQPYKLFRDIILNNYLLIYHLFKPRSSQVYPRYYL